MATPGTKLARYGVLENATMADISINQPDRLLSVREVFGIDCELQAPAFSERDDHVPEIDPVYRFSPAVRQISIRLCYLRWPALRRDWNGSNTRHCAQPSKQRYWQMSLKHTKFPVFLKKWPKLHRATRPRHQ